MPTPRAYVFDAYGTLLDVHSAVARHAAEIGSSAGRLSDLWRVKQLEYSWVHSLVGRYVDFWTLTERSLDTAAAALELSLTSGTRAALLEAYRTLDAYAEVGEVLRALKERGAVLAILSNGTPDMLRQAVRAAGIDDRLDDILSVDTIGVYKPDARVYAMVGERFGVPPDAVAFQSSNAWDAAGARAFGFTVNWVNRSGRPREYASVGDVREMRDLRDLLA